MAYAAPMAPGVMAIVRRSCLEPFSDKMKTGCLVRSDVFLSVLFAIFFLHLEIHFLELAMKNNN